MSGPDRPVLAPPPPFTVGDKVVVRATSAPGTIVEVFQRHRTADVDLGDGITAELDWDELELVTLVH